VEQRLDKANISGVNVVVPDTAAFLKDSTMLADTEVILADPSVFVNVYNAGLVAPTVKWLQCTWAGVNSLVKEIEGVPDFACTRCAGILGPIMAQYTVCWVLALERKLVGADNVDAVAQQRKAKDWPGLTSTMSYRPFSAVRIAVLGVGDIGICVATALKGLGATVVGFKRKVHDVDREGMENMGVNELTDSIDEALAGSDYVINVLPSTPATVGLLDGGKLGAAKQGATFINVGRGDIVGEDSLLHALEKGWLSSAVLDVFAVEPLPAESLLWDHDEVFISPHNAAQSFPADVANVFVENMGLYKKGGTHSLKHVVDWDQGY
jgi:phosphoglycerate dehydrogenase-like enzyme